MTRETGKAIKDESARDREGRWTPSRSQPSEAIPQGEACAARRLGDGRRQDRDHAAIPVGLASRDHPFNANLHIEHHKDARSSPPATPWCSIRRRKRRPPVHKLVEIFVDCGNSPAGALNAH